MRGVMILCAVVLARCGDADPPGFPRMDDLSRRTLEAWHAKEHHLGRAGVRRATCALEVTLPGAEGAPRTTKGVFTWDGERAGTRWEDEELGNEADHADLQASDWCEIWIEPWWNLPCYRGAALRGRRTGDGGVVIEFTHSDEPHALSFDAEGVLTGAEWGAGGRRRVERFAYERRDGRWLLKSCETLSADGALVCRREIEHEPVAGYVVPRFTRLVVAADAGQEASELRLTDWKLSDEAK